MKIPGWWRLASFIPSAFQEMEVREERIPQYFLGRLLILHRVERLDLNSWEEMWKFLEGSWEIFSSAPVIRRSARWNSWIPVFLSSSYPGIPSFLGRFPTFFPDGLEEFKFPIWISKLRNPEFKNFFQGNLKIHHRAWWNDRSAGWNSSTIVFLASRNLRFASFQPKFGKVLSVVWMESKFPILEFKSLRWNSKISSKEIWKSISALDGIIDPLDGILQPSSSSHQETSDSHLSSQSLEKFSRPVGWIPRFHSWNSKVWKRILKIFSGSLKIHRSARRNHRSAWWDSSTIVFLASRILRIASFHQTFHKLLSGGRMNSNFLIQDFKSRMMEFRISSVEDRNSSRSLASAIHAHDGISEFLTSSPHPLLEFQLSWEEFQNSSPTVGWNSNSSDSLSSKLTS